MEEAKRGLKLLRIIYTSLKNKEQLVYRDSRTTSVIESILSFSGLDLHAIYDEIFNSTSYTLVSEYKRFLELIIFRLKKEEVLIELDELGTYFLIEYDKSLSKGFNQIEELYTIVKQHRDRKNSDFSVEDNRYSELIDEYDRFIIEYNMKIDVLVSTGNHFINMNQKLWEGRFTIEEFIEKLEYIYFLSESRLKELDEPQEIFNNEVMVLAAYKIFTDLELIKEISVENFKKQFQFRNRKLTLERTKNSKKYLARAIFRLTPFIMKDYQDVWEEKLSSYFEINSYSKIKNKNEDNEYYDYIEDIIKSFEKLI